MSQNNGLNYSPHFKTSAVKRGPSSSYQELSNGYNLLYQPQAFAAIHGAPNVPHYPFHQTIVAYPANMMTTNDGENIIGSTMSQDSSNGFAFPVVTTQTLGNPALDGSSMQQIAEINHQNPDVTFAGGPQAQMMVAYRNGYINNTHDFSTKEVTPTSEALFPGRQDQLDAASPIYAQGGNSRPKQVASGLEVYVNTQAIQRPDSTSNTQIRASSQPVAHSNEKIKGNREGNARILTSSPEEKVNRDDKDNSRLTVNARSKPRARSALPGGSGYHGLIPWSDGRHRTLNHVPSQSDASQVKSLTPVNSEIQSSFIPQPSFQGSTYLEGDGMLGLQKPHNPPQAPSASDYKSRVELSESLKSQRRSLPEFVLSSNSPMENMQLDHSGRVQTVISSSNTHNLRRNLIRGEGLEQEALSANLSTFLGARNSDATVTPSNMDTDSSLVMGRLKSQVQRTVSQADAVKYSTGGLAAESANGDDVEMEIKETIERMLQYKSLHPSKFSKAWVQVKNVSAADQCSN